MTRLFKKIYTPLVWTIFIEVLFLLPGSALPTEEVLFNFNLFFDGFDKVCHFIFFTLFVSLWSLYFSSQSREFKSIKAIFFIIFVIAITNGIVVEYIQFYFIPFRSFDKGDIIADMLGASLTYGLCNLFLLKETKQIDPE